MLRIGIVLVALAVPVTANADSRGYAETDPDLLTSLRTPRLGIGLTSTQTAFFLGTTIGAFVGVGRNAGYSCEPDSFCLDFSGLATGGFAIGAVFSMGMTAWSISLLVRSVHELHARERGVINRASSMRFNRRMMAYNMLVTLISVSGAITAFAVAEPQLRAMAVGIAVSTLAGLNLWSFVLNAREGRARKRYGEGVTPKRKRAQFIGTGVRW